jgi:hypothetical protein
MVEFRRYCAPCRHDWRLWGFAVRFRQQRFVRRSVPSLISWRLHISVNSVAAKLYSNTSREVRSIPASSILLENRAVILHPSCGNLICGNRYFAPPCICKLSCVLAHRKFRVRDRSVRRAPRQWIILREHHTRLWRYQ